MYWLDPEEKNQPIAYLGSVDAGERSAYLISLFKKFVGVDKSVLEVGCNVGRNLFYLWNAGYKNIAGVELFPKAAKFAKLAFEDHDVNIYVGDFNQLELPQVDVVYTMAVFEHIPEDDAMKKVSDMARETIICIEDELTSGSRHFKRNYSDVFMQLGWKQVFSEKGIPGLDSKYYFARVFKND